MPVRPDSDAVIDGRNSLKGKEQGNTQRDLVRMAVGVVKTFVLITVIDEADEEPPRLTVARQ